MADTNKAEKLAAARKKLKEFQQRNQQSPSASQPGRADISSPASVTSQSSSVELKPSMLDNFLSEPQQQYSPEGNYQHFPTSYETSHAPPQMNYYSEGVYPAEQNQQNYAPYYNNEALSAAAAPNEYQIPSETSQSYANNGYGVNNEYSLLLSQISEKDNTIASLQTQLQTLALSSSSNKSQELTNALQDLEMQWSHKCNDLEEQLRLHTQTVNILVAEKSEYQAKLSKATENLQNRSSEVDEFQSQFRMLQQKLSEAEAALSAAQQDRSSKDQLATDGQKKCQELSGELKKVAGERDEHKQQASQLQQRMNVTMQQVAMLQAELQEKQSQLTSTHVRLKQLGGSLKETDDGSAVDELKMEREKSSSLEKHIAELKADFAEKEQASNQYQQFVHQLNQQLSTLAIKLQGANQENERLKEQNEQMVEHVSSLESRLNKASQLNAHTAAPVADSSELDQAKLELVNASEENLKLREMLEAHEIQRDSFEESILQYQEAIRRFEEERPDEKKLMAAMESDRVAAQRAIAQNTKLKDQLIEMEQMKAQMVEQLHTLEARARQSQTLQECLIESQEEIKKLKSELNSKHKEKSPNTQVNGNGIEIDETTLTPEASIKLQGRFTDVMKKLADASDEKQKLEHLVMQLQGETETIGEYVALYQQQRCVLRERAAEKDREIERMATDREELVLKLKQVGHLVLQLVNGQREDNSVPLTEPKDYETVALEIADQITGLLNQMEDSNQVTTPMSDEELLELHDKRNALGLNQETMLPCPCCSGRLEVV